MTAIVDEFGTTLRRGYRKEIFIGIVCIIKYLIGLAMVAEVCNQGVQGKLFGHVLVGFGHGTFLSIISTHK